MKLRQSIILSSLVLLPAFAYAEMEPIIVTPTRTVQAENKSSATVYVVDSEEIEKSGATTTTELLRGIPGIQISDLFGNGTETRIGVRGFSSTANANTLVLVNGRRLNHSDTSNPDLHHIFPKDIERIEVLSGSAGSLYGDQAVGGVVNIITKRWTQDYQRVGVSVGSFGHKGIEFGSSQRIADSLSYRISAQKFEADHYRDHSAEENGNVHGVLEYSNAGQRIFVELQRIEDKLELPGAIIQAEYDADPTQSHADFAGDFYDEDTTVTRIGYERDLGNQIISIDATHRRSDAQLLQSFRNSPSTSTGFTHRKNLSLNPKMSGVYSGGIEIPYVVGIDLEETDYDNQLPTYSISNEQEVENVYFQLTPRVTDMLQLTFGMRHSSVENNVKDRYTFPTGLRNEDDVTVGELGLAFYLDDNTKITARYDEGFRFAKVNELTGADPSKLLKTQTGESFELGLDLDRGDHQWTVSIYRLDLENEIVYDPNLFININLDNTRRDGMTLSLASQLGSKLSIKTELGLVNAKFKSGFFEGKDISGVASKLAKIRADYQFRGNLTSYLEARYTGEKFAQADNANAFGKLPSFTVFNAGISYQQRNWDIQLRVNNLTDKKYAEFITDNGRTVAGTRVSYRAYQPSPERNYMLKANYQFQ